MNFSAEVKKELVSKTFESACCKHSALSAYIRSAGYTVTEGGKVGFEFFADRYGAAKYFAELIEEMYGLKAEKIEAQDKHSDKQKSIYRFVNDESLQVLADLGIVEIDEQGIALKLNIDFYSIEEDCCKVAYIKGTFLGSGSVTIPKAEGGTTGYHLEFVFTNYQTATDFCEILSEVYFLPKLIERKGNYIVYMKNRDEITELFGVMGAHKAVLTLSSLAVEKDFSNKENRRLNCEMSNMTKQIDASIKQICAIDKIDETIGLDSLPTPLREVATARIENKNMTLSELGQLLDLSKSCINHRLRKIVEISENL